MARMVRFWALWYATLDRLVTLHRISASSLRWQIFAVITGWGLQLVATRAYYACSQTESWDEETLIWYNDVRYLAQFAGPIFSMILEYEARPFFPQLAGVLPRWGQKTAAESQASDVDDADNLHPEGILFTTLIALENSKQENSYLRSVLETLKTGKDNLRSDLETLKTENENLRNGISGRAEQIRNLEQEKEELIQKNDSLRRQEATSTEHISKLTARISDVTMRNDVLETVELEHENLRKENNG